ncbi:hypothetical protein BGZ70_007587 [Mortierella alpina]|uniref:Uncharacterized protein n=1 Tax=Mortierella alpina TaxID=64518 RepID=A0A9P6J5Q6_MORAP|nr:hypothetical protein BGZ70_007587 [Mortierella alpina]
MERSGAHYRGSLSQEKLRLARANAKRILADKVLVAKKHMQVQRSMEQGIDEHTNPAASPKNGHFAAPESAFEILEPVGSSDPQLQSIF